MLSVAEIINLLNSIPVGYKSPEDNCFNAANQMYIPEYKKLGVITVANELQDNLPEPDENDLFCDVPGCQIAFENSASYQAHFYNVHRYLCSVCRRCLPTAHLLRLHILECHDSYFIIRAKRGDAVYSCFLGECKVKLPTPKQRREHCINKHKFPANYRFEQLCGKPYKRHTKKPSKSVEANEIVDDMDVVADIPNMK
ncbi:protein lethal(2)k10201 [Bactrocera neohumeralis]|uniref:protein lethal(2)k10201 n=1 Tax=Bactrocera neohumeralis TaxID=98809 RepID=UPI0021652062|nr:protein lethal(2)k10201 [Bactrocera neohumeralis]